MLNIYYFNFFIDKNKIIFCDCTMQPFSDRYQKFHEGMRRKNYSISLFCRFNIS